MTNAAGSVGLGWGVLAGLSVIVLTLLAWRTRKRAAIARPGLTMLSAPRHDETNLVTFESRELDVEYELWCVLATLQDAAQRHQVELQVAVQPRLTVWADPCAFRQMLTGMLARAIERTDGGGVLVTAAWHGGRVQVSVIDDSPATDPRNVAAALRHVEQCAALQGGTLEVETGNLHATRVVLRMPGIGMADPLTMDEADGAYQLTVPDALWTSPANVS
jgi:hypothetical protein